MAKWLRRFNLVATFVWIGLVPPTLIWWKDSILWIALMSIWANVVGHWSAYIAARAERATRKNGS